VASLAANTEAFRLEYAVAAVDMTDAKTELEHLPARGNDE
jgi:hypothetical protein